MGLIIRTPIHHFRGLVSEKPNQLKLLINKINWKGKKTLDEEDFPDNKVHGDILRGMNHDDI